MDAAIIISIVSTAVAVVGGVFGVITYSKNQTLKRQEIILPLMREFDTNGTLDFARTLLEHFPVDIRGPGQLQHTFTFDKLSTYLRDDKQTPVTDPAEIAIRNSFTALLDFFGKLGYLMDIGAITRRDLGYFEYYVSTASDNDGIIEYTKTYNFELYTILLDKMNLIPSTLTKKAEDYYQRNKKSIFRRGTKS
jgi:hypothetical protein